MSRFSVNILLMAIGSVLFANTAQAQASPKIVAECTLVYSVSINGSQSGQTEKRLYIKGRKTRSEISNTSFYQATIYDNKEGNAVILKEVGDDKYISFFSSDQWKEKNSFWDSSTVVITNLTKKILTYNCRKALIQTKDSNRYTVYYTTDITASATENPYQFKGIAGLVLEYTSESKRGEYIECVATDISFIPVPAAKFAIPTSGYRVIK